MKSVHKGQLLDYLSTDVDRIVNFFPSFQELWSMPLQIFFSTFLLYQQVGISSFAGIVFIIILIPINKVLANKIGFYSTNFMISKDGRMKVLTDFLQTILTVKVGCYEKIYCQQINEQRKLELKYLKKQKYLDAFCVIFWAICPVVICSSTFSLYILLGNKINSSKVLTSFSLFNLLIGPMNSLPWVINGLVEAMISLRRINSVPRKEYCEFINLRNEEVTESKNFIELNGAWFSWTKNVDDINIDPTALLKNIFLHIKKNQYIGIVGDVGCGKSSFLLAILKEMYHVKGHFKLSPELGESSIAFVSEKPWLIKRSIRENIVMFEEFEPDWYSQVVIACCLDKDFVNMKNGDMTTVADEGVSLSGGQKSRICLARAVYHRAKLYLLDDPLSSLDAKVTKFVVEEVISKLLLNTTVIMTSHNPHLFTKFKSTIRVPDEVYFINNGFMESYNEKKDVLASKDSIIIDNDYKEADLVIDDIIPSKVNTTNVKEVEKEEHLEVGSIKRNVYLGYIRLVGGCLTGIILMSLLLMQATKNGSEYWLSFWSSSVSKNNSDKSVHHYLMTWSLFEVSLFRDIKDNINDLDENFKYFLTIYLIIVSGNILFSIVRAFSFAYGGIRASYQVHEKLLSVLIRAKLEFFEQTPRGRILNRFTSDLSTIDDNLPFIFNVFLANLFACLGSLLVVIVSLPSIISIIAPLVFVCFYYQYFYRITSRAVKRLVSVNRSPLYSHFSEMIDGMIFIRNYRYITKVLKDNKCLLLNLIRCEYSGLLLSSWLSIRLQMIGVIFITIVILISLVASYLTSINKGLIGLACVYSFTLTNLLSGVIITATESEKEFVAVERCLEYIPSKDNIHQIPLEDFGDDIIDIVVHNHICKDEMYGASVEFKNVYLRYVANDTYALSNISVKISPGCNIGVIGRTGSGKSSLMKLLFRLLSYKEDLLLNQGSIGYHGEIFLNDIETRTIPLHTLRTQISFMLQDSVLFTETLRHNLDPNDVYSDDELMGVVKKLCIERYFPEFTSSNGVFNLESLILNQGRELSYGQQQLLSLGRILLSCNQIVCLDEPSSHMDSSTESIIEDVIGSQFADKTVIIIGHRLPMLLRLCDSLLILSEGNVVEYGAVNDLLQNPMSILNRYLCEV